jgi:hypothetical protein
MTAYRATVHNDREVWGDVVELLTTSTGLTVPQAIDRVAAARNMQTRAVRSAVRRTSERRAAANTRRTS